MVDGRMDLNLDGNLGLFTDDTHEGMAVSKEEDAWRIQNDLIEIGRWSNLTNMIFNCGKFECLKTGFNLELKTKYDYLTPDLELTIENKDNIKDLGIWMSSSGDFSYHISKVISKVRQRIGWINRSFRTNDVDFKKFMWRTYISGLLDYNSQLWCPIEEGKVSSLEQLLRSYTANTDGLQSYNYWERLKRMGLSSIQRRFQRYRIIYLWKVIAGLTHNYGLTWRIDEHKGIIIDIKQLKYYQVKGKVLNIWRQSIGVSGAALFNSMPYKVRNYEGKSISGFKMTLDQVLENIPDCPLSYGLYPDPINPVTNRNSNCLTDWSHYLKLPQRKEIDIHDVLL